MSSGGRPAYVPAPPVQEPVQFAYDSGVVRLSAERWALLVASHDDIIARLDRIEALLTRSYAESEWQWPDGVTGTPA